MFDVVVNFFAVFGFCCFVGICIGFGRAFFEEVYWEDEE